MTVKNISNFGESGAGGVGAGPCPVEVVAAEPASYIQCFADEVQAGDMAGLHGFGQDAFGIHATNSDFCLWVAFGSGGSWFPMVEE